MIDPATADVTARVAECLARFGWPASHPVVKRALHFLEQDQCEDGAWFGRWGVNYVYGTSGVLRALEPMGLTGKAYAQRGADWLRSVQYANGGFGESIASYADPSQKGRGPVTASQTAWGVIGLLAAAGPDDSSARRAMQFLLDTQTPQGSWEESEFTGTGFPEVFYLKYHLYRHNFPLYALARYRNALSGAGEFRFALISPDSLETWRAERRRGRRRSLARMGRRQIQSVAQAGRKGWARRNGGGAGHGHSNGGGTAAQNSNGSSVAGDPGIQTSKQNGRRGGA